MSVSCPACAGNYEIRWAASSKLLLTMELNGQNLEFFCIHR